MLIYQLKLFHQIVKVNISDMKLVLKNAEHIFSSDLLFKIILLNSCQVILLINSSLLLIKALEPIVF